jgi:hypothetical protein
VRAAGAVQGDTKNTKQAKLTKRQSLGRVALVRFASFVIFV